MNKDNAKQFLPIVQALADGKTIQISLSTGWTDFAPTEEIKFSSNVNEYRIKPEPKLRAWKPEEVPVGALLREVGHDYRWLITAYADGKAFVGAFGAAYPLRELTTKHEHSTDNGKTWLPCGVEESA